MAVSISSGEHPLPNMTFITTMTTMAIAIVVGLNRALA